MRVESEVVSSPMLIRGRMMTTEKARPSTSRPELDTTRKLGRESFDDKLRCAPAKEHAKRKIQLCKTLVFVADTPMFHPPHERGPVLEIR